jgi:hypothetical protein
MPAYVLTFDLFKGDRSDYQKLHDALGRLKAAWATESACYVASAMAADKLAKHLRQFMHKKDVLTVDEMKPGTGHVSYGLSAEALDWKARHLKVLPAVPQLRSQLPVVPPRVKPRSR